MNTELKTNFRKSATSIQGHIGRKCWVSDSPIVQLPYKTAKARMSGNPDYRMFRRIAMAAGLHGGA